MADRQKHRASLLLAFLGVLLMLSAAITRISESSAPPLPNRELSRPTLYEKPNRFLGPRA